jgi:hypothetical protein
MASLSILRTIQLSCRTGADAERPRAVFSDGAGRTQDGQASTTIPHGPDTRSRRAVQGLLFDTFWCGSFASSGPEDGTKRDPRLRLGGGGHNHGGVAGEEREQDHVGRGEQDPRVGPAIGSGRCESGRLLAAGVGHPTPVSLHRSFRTLATLPQSSHSKPFKVLRRFVELSGLFRPSQP